MGQTNQESIPDLGFLPCEPFLPGGNHGVRILVKSAPSGVLSVKTVFLLAFLYHKVKTKSTTRIHKKMEKNTNAGVVEKTETSRRGSKTETKAETIMTMSKETTQLVTTTSEKQVSF